MLEVHKTTEYIITNKTGWVIGVISEDNITIAQSGDGTKKVNMSLEDLDCLIKEYNEVKELKSNGI